MVAGIVDHAAHTRDIRRLGGLARAMPLTFALAAVAALSMAGIPPLAGFVGKFFLFSSAIDAGYLWIAVLGFVLSMVSVYYYLNVVKVMYLGAPADTRPFDFAMPVRLTAVFAMAATLAMGVYPGPLSKLADMAAKTVFK